MSGTDQSPSGAIRLLLVDDEHGYVDVLAKRMAKRNIEATPAYSGTEAIQVLRKKSFDAAVLDLKMEDMDGIEVLKIFKKMDPSDAGHYAHGSWIRNGSAGGHGVRSLRLPDQTLRPE